MTEAPLLSLCAAHIDIIADLVPFWEKEGEMVDSSAQGSEIVTHLIRVFRTTSEALDALRTALFLNKIKKTQPIGLVACDLLPRMIALAERIRRHLRRQAEKGCVIEQRDDIEKAIDQFRKDAVDFLKNWPWVDFERIAKSEAAFRRGEYQDAREALNELLH
jgi:hypothetical protein